MKKYIISIIMTLACVSMYTGCSEDSFDDRYKNPSKTSDIDLDKMMTGTLLYSKEWIMSTYGRFFGWEIQNLCKQVNTIGWTPGNGEYYNIEGYTSGMPPYGELSKMITGFRFMERIYNELPDAEKAQNEIYLLPVQTVMYGLAAYIMSSFGDVPFNEVGMVAATEDISYGHPSYQDDKELYKQVLDKLDEMNTKFAAIKKEDIPTTFIGQDFICKGDMAAWRRLANSLRLRIALQLSTQGDLTSAGQQAIRQILDDPNGHPIIETNEQHICYKQVYPNSELDVNGGSGFDWVNLKTASTEIIKRMQKEGDGGLWDKDKDDPRLPLYFCLATKNGEFPADPGEAQYEPEPEKDAYKDKKDADGNPMKVSGKALPTVFRGGSASMDYDTFWKYFDVSDTRAYISRIRENGFFRNNRNWDNPVLTASEVWFIRAEAYQRGWATGDAKAAFKKGIALSIKFYMEHHKNKTTDETSITGDDRGSRHARAVINPDLSIYTDTWIDAFAEDRWTTKIDGSSYEGGMLEAILEQKWLNFGYFYAGEQWNDLRRTGYPRMTYLKDHDPTAEIPYPRNRNRYPSSDRDYNMSFDQVKAQDNYSDVLFWAIRDWHDGPTW